MPNSKNNRTITDVFHIEVKGFTMRKVTICFYGHSVGGNDLRVSVNLSWEFIPIMIRVIAPKWSVVSKQFQQEIKNIDDALLR